MVIDNDESILDVMSIILEECNYKVFTFLEPPVTSFMHSYPDLIILDIGPNNRRNKDFFDFLKTKRSSLNIPVILTSTKVGLESIAKNWQAESFLNKPFDINHLVSLVKDLLGSNKTLS